MQLWRKKTLKQTFEAHDSQSQSKWLQIRIEARGEAGMSITNLRLDIPEAGSTCAGLSGRILKISQTVRFAAPVLAGWLLVESINLWSRTDRIDNYFGALFKKDLSGVTPWQQCCGFTVYLLIWSLVAAACYSVWRAFSAFLDGRIFSLDATLWLKRVALFGVTAKLLEIFTRPLISLILTLHFPAGQKQRLINLYLTPNDFIILALLLVLLAFAYILIIATEIAQENAQIV